ncbi:MULTISPECIES: hypothetical protein [unclassified Coleofasciculus]|uniref:hypothetical protein n=1 Tax=unclassified Coleofasciculus TaxID=2692782 RepID=UPI00187E7827|nr:MULTISPECIES: hypothetical protein [unclassified Coleofasciculus]MBE9128758.1 hypothetical protein [Coleofasciculus sp. LEGE 07081]MBE9151231.1 hypothetical protein [Coleofasciculus sp. LEGE 07092]
MAYWIKITYERSDYVIDLDRISAFACAPSGKITFWLPNSAHQIIINQQSDSEGYHQILDYIKEVLAQSLSGSWIRVNYERNEYIIDLNRISSFCYASRSKLTFWLPDSSIPIIISEQNDPDTYQRILDYVKRKTGYVLP